MFMALQHSLLIEKINGPSKTIQIARVIAQVAKQAN